MSIGVEPIGGDPLRRETEYGSKLPILVTDTFQGANPVRIDMLRKQGLRLPKGKTEDSVYWKR